MKKCLKVIGIILASLLGVVLIAGAILVYVVFTPARLTPIVTQVADNYVSSEHKIGDVELTFFSTFPQIGVRINGLLVLNPKQGAQSDTVLAASDVVAKLNIKDYLQENKLNIYEVSLNGVDANIFFDAEGNTNLDFLNLPADTVEDTTAFSLPFSYLAVEELKVDAHRLTYLSLRDSMTAALQQVKLRASANGLEDIDLSLDCHSADLSLKGEQYLNAAKLKLDVDDLGADIENLKFDIPKAKLSLNQFDLSVGGNVRIADDITLDANVSAKEWDVVELLQILPSSLASKLEGIDIANGIASLDAHAYGVYNDSVMPLVDAKLMLNDAAGAYMQVFPYQLSDIALAADVHLDLNDKAQSNVQVSTLKARTGKTNINATAQVTELLADPYIDATADLNVSLQQFKRYISTKQNDNDMQGETSGRVAAKIKLSDLTGKRLSKGKIAANLKLKNVHVDYDSISVNIPSTTVDLSIPNSKPSQKNFGWARVTLKPSALDVNMPTPLAARLGESVVDVELSDVLSDNRWLYAGLSLTSSTLTAAMDSMSAGITKPQLTADVQYDMKRQQKVPKVNAELKMGDLDAVYNDITARLKATEISAKLSENKAAQPSVALSLVTDALDAAMSTDYAATTKRLSLKAKADKSQTDKENVLLQWNPELNVELSDGELHLSAIQDLIEIPRISFAYSNELFDIADSRVIVGNSDFALKGKVRNIGEWLEDTGVLKGDLEFTSDHTDVNELMALTSASEGTEEQPASSQEPKSTKSERTAYLVPKNVDVKLVTNISEALVFDQVARELGGQLYIKDGVLVLEEMGFICNAAKLQLTAIYKSPRKNHIYVGLDYHMIDIDMQELVNMIPQIDTMMPMLRSFRGAGEFHLAAETYTNGKYELKTSTTRGACSITGKDLVLLDSETFGKIAKILMFNRKTENLIDSVSVQATLFKNEIDIYPFSITMDKYMAAVGGRHNLDMSFDYHISLLKPLYLGVDVKGTFDDLKIKPAKCKYAADFRPIIRRDVETQNITLKKMIDQALKRNVKIYDNE